MRSIDSLLLPSGILYNSRSRIAHVFVTQRAFLHGSKTHPGPRRPFQSRPSSADRAVSEYLPVAQGTALAPAGRSWSASRRCFCLRGGRGVSSHACVRAEGGVLELDYRHL